MNKKTLRIAGVLAAFAMMAGVGATVGASQKAAIQTFATAVSGTGSDSLTFSSNHKVTADGNTISGTAGATYTFHTDSEYIALDSSTIHTGSGSKTCSYQSYTSGDFSSVKITSVVVNGYMASGSGVSATVSVNSHALGATAALQTQALTASAADYTFTNPSNYTGGNLVVTLSRSSATKKAIYCASITVNYVPQTVIATGISLDKSTADLYLGASGRNTTTITATITPNDTSDKTVTWASSDADIASVSGGVVTAAGDGAATITATSNSNGALSDTCAITVWEPRSLVITDTGAQTSYTVGDSVNYDGLVATMTWGHDEITKEEDVTDLAEWIDNIDSTLEEEDDTITYLASYAGFDSDPFDLSVEVTSDPAVYLVSTSVTGHTGKTVSLAYSSVKFMKTPTEYEWSIVSGGDKISIDGDDDNSTVSLLCGPSEGYATVRLTVTDEDDKTAYVDATITIEEYEVTALDWTAPTIDVYSGTVLSTSDADAWAVTFDDNDGIEDGPLDHDDFEVKLGGSVISLPHTWVAADDGKRLSVSFGGLDSSTSDPVRVIQTINAVNAPTISSWSHTITSRTWEASGAQTISSKSWSMSGTDGNYFGYDGTKGQQFGSGGSAYSALTLSSSAFTGTIDSVTVYTSGAKDIVATVQVSVGGTAYGSAETITASNAPYTFDLGGKTGEISIDWVQTSSKAIYVKQIVVNTVTGTSNIANSGSHKDAQYIAVKFANAFNSAMDTTSNCTTNMDSAWTTASAAFDAFETEAAALGETEGAYARKLIKYATVLEEWPNSFGDAGCIERMVKVYKTCVELHDKTAFMSDVRPDIAKASRVSFVGFSNDAGNLPLILTIIGSGALIAGGLYFIQRRRSKED